MTEKIARISRTPLLEQRSLRALGFPRKPVLLVGELVTVAIGVVQRPLEHSCLMVGADRPDFLVGGCGRFLGDDHAAIPWL